MSKPAPIVTPDRNGRPPGPGDWRETEILDLIRRLTSEKDSLRRSHRGRPLSATDSTRLQQFDSALDKSWELVRQRRARRAAGQGWDDLSQRVGELLESLTSR